MADVCLRPGRLDRINVQNDPVNWIDPYGLQPSTTPEMLSSAGSGGDCDSGDLEYFNEFLLSMLYYSDPAVVADIQFQMMADVTLMMMPMVMGLPPVAAPKLSKVPKSKTTEIVGRFTKTTEVRPGRGPGQSRAEYVRYKNSEGKVIRTYKDSYDRGNVFQGRKPLRGGPEGRPQ